MHAELLYKLFAKPRNVLQRNFDRGICVLDSNPKQERNLKTKELKQE